jgi:hypothetical protein
MTLRCLYREQKCAPEHSGCMNELDVHMVFGILRSISLV